MGRLPEAWIAPPATRELRELVRHRAKLVGLRSTLKCQGGRGRFRAIERNLARRQPHGCAGASPPVNRAEGHRDFRLLTEVRAGRDAR